MTIEKLLEVFNEKAQNIEPLGKKLKMELDDKIIMVDGTGDSNIVSSIDEDADTVISTTWENFEKLASGDLNPMMAVMTGKVKIKGDMGLAMKLQNLI